MIPTAVTLLLLLIISRHSSKLSPEGACSPSTELKQIHVGISTFSSSSNSKQACRSLHLSIKNVSVQGILPEDQIAPNLSLNTETLRTLGLSGSLTENCFAMKVPSVLGAGYQAFTLSEHQVCSAHKPLKPVHPSLCSIAIFLVIYAFKLFHSMSQTRSRTPPK